MDFEKEYDVLIAGAGVGGVAAALECARSGLSTAIVEKTVLLGGLATSGLVNIYLPLCDGHGRQVTFGIAEELLHLSTRYGPGDVPPGWRDQGEKSNKVRFRTPFSPASFALALDEAVTEAGVALWLDTLICSTIMDEDRTEGVEVENKSGRGALRAKCVIDATGDADVAFRAGARCEESGNWPAMWMFQCSLETAKQAVADGKGEMLLEKFFRGGGGGGELAPPDGGYRATDAAEVTRFLIDSRKLLLDHYKSRYAEGVDRRDLFPITLPSMAQYRTTRRIVGKATMRPGQEGKRVEDSIGLIADWRKPGYVWEVPYGALTPESTKGLVAAGRCISSEGDAWHVTRVIPCAALTGQAAGVAAALAVRSGRSPAEVDASEIQERLADKGIMFHVEHS